MTSGEAFLHLQIILSGLGFQEKKHTGNETNTQKKLFTYLHFFLQVNLVISCHVLPSSQ